MKDFILGVFMTLFTLFIASCCINLDDEEYDEVEDDYKPSKNRKRKTNK